MRSSLSEAMPLAEHSAMTMASLFAASSMRLKRSPASAEFTMGLPLARLYTWMPASMAFMLEVSSASGTLSKRSWSSFTAHCMTSSPSASAGPMFTSM